MAVYDLDQTTFLQTVAPTVDTTTQDQILAYLHDQGIYPGGLGTAPVQLAPYGHLPGPGTLAPPDSVLPAGVPAQIAEFGGPEFPFTSFEVDTDANPDIKAI